MKVTNGVLFIDPKDMAEALFDMVSSQLSITQIAEKIAKKYEFKQVIYTGSGKTEGIVIDKIKEIKGI